MNKLAWPKQVVGAFVLLRFVFQIPVPITPRLSRELPASLPVVSVRMHRKLGVTSRLAVSPSVVFCYEFVGGIHVRYASVTAVVKAVVLCIRQLCVVFHLIHHRHISDTLTQQLNVSNDKTASIIQS